MNLPEPVPAARKKAHFTTQLRYKRRWGIILITPWLIGLLIFKLAPILVTFGISFTDFFLLTPDTFKFVGLKNYITLVAGSEPLHGLPRNVQAGLDRDPHPGDRSHPFGFFAE